MNWFKNLNALPKLLLAFGMLLSFTIAVGTLGIQQISQLTEQNRQIFSRDVGGIDAIKQAEVDQALLAAVISRAPSSAGAGPTALADAEKEYQGTLADLKISLDLARERSIRPNLIEQLGSVGALIPEVEHSTQQVFTVAQSGNMPELAKAVKAALLLSEQMREATHKASTTKIANTQIFKEAADRRFRDGRTHVVELILIACTLALFAGITIARGISSPLKRAAVVLEHVANGDLTQTLNIDTQDEIGGVAKALNKALRNICDVMAEVGDASRNLTGASSQLAKASEVLSSGAHEQAASLEQTSASLEQITATVRQNSDNAKQASQIAISSKDAAERGGAVVNNAIRAMTEINEASSQIAAIIRAMDEIAFQTNLLAVNASVEAARAREHGKGFAVVATEVRSLAQRSGTAAKEIKSLIGDSRRKVENGSTLVNRSGETLTDILVSVKRVTDIVNEIAAASREQSTGIEQVYAAMLQMDRVMQSNSAQTEELSATANNLAGQSAHLEKLIGRFTVKPVAPKGKRESVTATLQFSGASTPAPNWSTGPSSPSATVSEVATTASLSDLAARVGPSVSTEALDREFEEF